MEVLWSEVTDDFDEPDIRQEPDEISFDGISYDEKSSSYRSDSVVSSKISRNSRRRSRTNSSVMSRSDRSTNYSRFSQSKKVPSAESEGQILNLLDGSGYPMIQINGQRILGPPPGWTGPAPDPSCEVFVGKIPRDLHEDAIYPIFNNIGKIYEIRLMMDFSGTNRGYCFVMFTKPEYAEKAIKELNNWEIRKGRRIGVVASINNCRLCIGQLPPDIDTEVVVGKFHEASEDVAKVSVYRNMNGQVRYALVSYRTHRGAAMARRRLLPERGTLFEHGEISIDWANPSMTSNNMVEEVGVRDESGGFKITRTHLGSHSKRSGFQRHAKDSFLEKSIKNYLQGKNSGQNNTNQRNKCVESSGFVEKSMSRVATFSGRQKHPNARANNRKSFDEARDASESHPQLHLENIGISGNQSVLWYPENHDFNGNIENSTKSAPMNLQIAKNDEAQDQPASSMAQNFSPEAQFSLNLFEHYKLLPELGGVNYEPTIRAISRRGSQQASICQNAENIADTSGSNSAGQKSGFRTLSFSEVEKFVSTANSLSNRRQEIVAGEMSNATRIDSTKNSRNQRKNNRHASVDAQKMTQRTKNSGNSRVLSQITNHNGICCSSQDNYRGYGCFGKNRGNAMAAKENHCCVSDENNFSEYRNSSQDYYNQPECFQQRIHPQTPLTVDRYGSHVFDNYFRGPNGRVDHLNSLPESATERPQISLPFSRGLYGTSSFADYRVPQIYLDRGLASPRPILSRMAAIANDEISMIRKNHL